MAAAAKPEEGKTPGTGEEDLSMEDILQSIRKIIAEDDTEGKKPVSAETAKPNGSPNGSKTEGSAGSDILELTEMIKEDGTVESIQPAAAPAASADVLNKIDEALTEVKPAEPAPVKIEEKPPEKPPEKPVAKPMEKPVEKPVEAAPAAPAASTDSLLSAEAASAAAAAFKRAQTSEPEAPPVVTTPAPPFRDGTTVEDLVSEMLRPMMKEWLDKNLPPIVERIVEREVKKLTR